MFQRTWFTAESLLSNAQRWVFVGYSLPATDFEFKYLLKRVELARETRPEIVLVTGGDKEAVRITIENYQRFFGDRINDPHLFVHGIDKAVIDRLT